MPPLKKKGACATGTHAFTQHLEAELLEARRRVQETAECVTSARHREAALADMCRCIEDIQALQARHGGSKSIDSNSCSDSCATGQDEGCAGTAQGQHASVAAAHSASASGQQHHHNMNGGNSTAPRQGQQAQCDAKGVDLAMLGAVPDYCCLGHLLRSASPQLVAAARRLTSADFAQIFTKVVYELTLLLELVSRAQPDEQQQYACAAQSGSVVQDGAGMAQGTPVRAHASRSMSCSSSGGAACSTPAAAEAPQGDASAAAATAAAADAAARAAAGDGCASAAAAAATTGESAALQRLTRSAIGLSFLSMAVNPEALYAASVVNHWQHGAAGAAGSTAADAAAGAEAHGAGHQQQQQQQQHAGGPGGAAPPEPPGYWQRVVRRLQLTPEQAGFLAACAAEATRLIKAQREQLSRLFAASCTPGLQVLAAQASQDGAAAAAAAAAAAPECSSAVAGATPPPAAAPPASAAPVPAPMSSVSSCLTRQSLIISSLQFLVVDCLTDQQTATLLVASYPMMPRGLAVAHEAGVLLPELLQQQAAGLALRGAQQQERQQHVQHLRQQWWTDLLHALPPDDLGVLRGGSGCGSSLADAVAGA